MHVSMQTGYAAEANTRVQARRRLEDDASGREMRRILENPNEGRRQGNFSRRSRPNTPRQRDPEDYAAEARPSYARSAPPFPASAKAAEFWTLLGAVAPDEVAHGAGENTIPAKAKPSLDELFAQVIATH